MRQRLLKSFLLEPSVGGLNASVLGHRHHRHDRRRRGGGTAASASWYGELKQALALVLLGRLGGLAGLDRVPPLPA